LVTLALPVLNHVFLGFAGFLQLRSVSVGWGNAIRAAADAPLNLALVQAASVGVIFAVAFPHRARKERFADAVYVRPLYGGVAGLCFVAGAFLQLPLAELGNLAQEVFPVSFETLAHRHRLVNPTTWMGGVSALIAFVLVAPTTEELLFRGWLLKELQDRHGARTAVLSTSVLFGLAHVATPSAFLYATVGGLVLGVVALRTRSTLGSIAMHAGVNAVPLLVPSELIRIEGFNTLDLEVKHVSAWLLGVALLGMAGTLMLLWKATDAPAVDR
jgi:membrane protease YdiL (CAAX protease family)